MAGTFSAGVPRTLDLSDFLNNGRCSVEARSCSSPSHPSKREMKAKRPPCGGLFIFSRSGFPSSDVGRSFHHSQRIVDRTTYHSLFVRKKRESECRIQRR